MVCSQNARARPRDGIALPIALAAIVVVAALIAGVFFASTQEYRVGRNTLGTQRALHGAEVGLSQVVSSWTAARTTDTRVGQTVRMQDTIIDSTLVQRQYTKVSPTVFWITSTAVGGSTALSGRSLKRLNTIIRIQTPDFKIMGAVTSRGLTNLGGSTKISGNDTMPPGWDCPPSGPPAAGLVVGDSAATVTSGGANCSTSFNCITGDPKVKDSTAIVNDTMTYTRFGGFSYDSLTLLANKVKTVGGTYGTIGPVLNADGTCNTAAADNWGAITQPHACGGYYPIVHLKGPTQSWIINGGGGGQGIMLVDGNLSVQGNFQWTGIIIVRGTFSISGTGGGGGAKVIGGVAAMNRGGGTNNMAGNSSITFSRCAINQVTARHSLASPTKYRAWADLSF